MVVDADDAVDADAEVVENFNGVTCISDNVFWNDLNFLCDKRVSLQTNNHMCCGHLHLGPLVFSLWSSLLLEVCSPHMWTVEPGFATSAPLCCFVDCVAQTLVDLQISALHTEILHIISTF